MPKKLDDLFTKLRNIPQNQPDLPLLEGRVWQRIDEQRREQPSGQHEHFLAFFFPAGYRIAPLISAFMLGGAAWSFYNAERFQGYKCGRYAQL